MSRLHHWLAVVFVLSGSVALAQYEPPPSQGQPAPPQQGGNFSSSPSNPYGQYSPFPPPPTRKAFIRVFVPDDRAKVAFNDHETTSTGGSRLFETPPLTFGQTYTYTVKATWNIYGRPVTQERRVVVIPGQYAMANFMVPAQSEQIPAPPANGQY